MDRLSGKVAFLTGAGAGIARATANAYVREGGKVVIADLDKQAGQAAEREIVQARATAA